MIYVKPGRGSGLIFICISLLSLKTFKRNTFPISAFSTSSSKALGSLIEIFSAAITKSPLLKPAFSAGLLGITDWIRAPFLSGNWTNELGSLLCSLAILGFKEISWTPKYGWITSPFLRSWSETLLARLIGIAKPKPAPGPLLTNVFIPITSVSYTHLTLPTKA